jgi:hypothetical protein
MHSLTLQDIHRDPAVLDRALEQREPVEILDDGKVAGTLVPAAAGALRFSERGFPISRGLLPFGAADVAAVDADLP